MDSVKFDAVTRLFGSGMSRREALRGLVAGATALGGGGALLLAEDASAKRRRKSRRKNKNKKQKKNKNQNVPQDPAPVGAVVTCSNLGTACGLGTNTLVCNCRLNKEGAQTCANVVNPPNGVSFNTCNLSSDCPAGQTCEFGANVCRSTCQTG